MHIWGLPNELIRCLPHELFLKACEKFILVLNVAANLFTGVRKKSFSSEDSCLTLHNVWFFVLICKSLYS